MTSNSINGRPAGCRGGVKTWDHEVTKAEKDGRKPDGRHCLLCIPDTRLIKSLKGNESFPCWIQLTSTRGKRQKNGVLYNVKRTTDTTRMTWESLYPENTNLSTLLKGHFLRVRNSTTGMREQRTFCNKHLHTRNTACNLETSNYQRSLQDIGPLLQLMV